MTEQEKEKGRITKDEPEKIMKALKNSLFKERWLKRAPFSGRLVMVEKEGGFQKLSSSPSDRYELKPEKDLFQRDIQNQLDVLHSRVVKNEKQMLEQELLIKNYIELYQDQNESIKDFLKYISTLSRSKGLKSELMERYFPVEVYLSENNEDTEYKVHCMLSELYDSLNAIDVWSSPIEISSFIGKWVAKTKDVVSQDDFTNRLKKLEGAAEKEWLKKPQAQIDSDTALAVKALMEAVRDQPNAIVRAGSLFIIKAENKVVINNLNDEQISLYESNPVLWTEPMKLIEALKEQQEEGNRIPKLGT